METALLWVTAIGAILTAVATVGLVIVAQRTLGGAREQLDLLRKQVVREGRPYVVAEVVPGLHGAGFSDLVIANIGRTLARDVTVDVGALEKRDDTDHISDGLRKYLTTPRTIVPGVRQRVMWRMEPHHGHSAAGADRSAVTGTVRYKDDDGTVYEDCYDLSVDTMINATPVPSEGPKVSGGSRTKIETSLADINHAVRTLNIHVGELRR